MDEKNQNINTEHQKKLHQELENYLKEKSAFTLTHQNLNKITSEVEKEVSK